MARSREGVEKEEELVVDKITRTGASPMASDTIGGSLSELLKNNPEAAAIKIEAEKRRQRERDQQQEEYIEAMAFQIKKNKEDIDGLKKLRNYLFGAAGAVSVIWSIVKFVVPLIMGAK